MNRSLASPCLNNTVEGNGFDRCQTNPFMGIDSIQRIPSEEHARDLPLEGSKGQKRGSAAHYKDFAQSH